MSQEPGPRELQLDDNLAHQRREWLMQRIGWVVLALLVLASLLGLTGSGLLSRARVTASEGWQVEYNRFTRLHAQETLRVNVPAGAAEGGELRLWLGRDYLDAIELQQVVPRPLRAEAGPDRHTFVFRVSDPDRPTTITIRFEPDQIGSLPGQVGVGVEEAVRFRQFVYP
jgi:hypothetical protein